MAVVKVPAGEFKTHCLALLDEVASTGVELVVTKRGRPVARVVALAETGVADLTGSVSYKNEADLLAPIPEAWEAEG